VPNCLERIADDVPTCATFVAPALASVKQALDALRGAPRRRAPGNWGFDGTPDRVAKANVPARRTTNRRGASSPVQPPWTRMTAEQASAELRSLMHDDDKTWFYAYAMGAGCTTEDNNEISVAIRRS
jgi:hypothetical protein